MYEKYLLIILIFFYSHCSFDNKSGIWTNNSKVDKEKAKDLKTLKSFILKEKSFNKVVLPKKDSNLLLEPIKQSKRWQDEFYSETNNFNNFKFENLNEVILKQKINQTQNKQESIV